MNLWIFCLLVVAYAEVRTLQPLQYLVLGNPVNITYDIKLNIVLDLISLTDSRYNIYMAFVECATGLNNIQYNQISPESQLDVSTYNLDRTYMMKRGSSYCIAIVNPSPTNPAQILYNFSTGNAEKQNYLWLIIVCGVLASITIFCWIGYICYKKHRFQHERLAENAVVD